MTLGDLARGPARAAASSPRAPRLPEALAARRALGDRRTTRASAVPGRVFVALRGLKADGAAFAPQAVARGAAAVVAESPAPAGVDGAVGAGRATRGSRSPRSPPSFFGHPSRRAARSSASPAPTARRRRAYLLRVDLRGRRHPVRPARHRRLPHRRREDREATRTTPEAPDLQRMLREMVDQRLRRVRDGGVVARARAAPRRRHALRRRRSSPT